MADEDREPIKKRCPRCGHHKAWLSRGQQNPAYKFKCTKCGNKVY